MDAGPLGRKRGHRGRRRQAHPRTHVLPGASAEAKGSGGSGSPGGDSAARRALSSIATVLEQPIVPKLWNLLSSFSVAYNFWQVTYRRLEEGVKFKNLSETLKSTSAEVFGGADASVPELKEKGVRGHVLALDKEIHGNPQALTPQEQKGLSKYVFEEVATKSDINRLESDINRLEGDISRLDQKFGVVVGALSVVGAGVGYLVVKELRDGDRNG